MALLKIGCGTVRAEVGRRLEDFFSIIEVRNDGSIDQRY